MTQEKHETAVTLIAGEINRLEAELEDLRASYMKLGGVFEEAEAAAETPQRRSAGPKRRAAARTAGEATGGGVTINGVFVSLTRQQHNVVELMLAAPDRMLDLASLTVALGGSKTRPGSVVRQANVRLEAAQVRIVNVWGMGYRMEKLP